MQESLLSTAGQTTEVVQKFKNSKRIKYPPAIMCSNSNIFGDNPLFESRVETFMVKEIPDKKKSDDKCAFHPYCWKLLFEQLGIWEKADDDDEDNDYE